MNVSTKVLRAGINDVDLARQAVVEIHGRGLLEDSGLVAFLADPTCYMLLAVEGASVVGSLNGYSLRHPHLREPQLLLYEIDVRPESRRRGVGRALVESFTAEARAAGAFEVWVLTNAINDAAMTMYQRCGYARRSEDDVMLSLRF